MDDDATTTQMSAEHRYNLVIVIVDRFATTVRFVTGIFLACFFLYYFSKTLVAYSGTSTDLVIDMNIFGTIVLELASKIGKYQIISWGITIIALLYGFLERRLRYNKVVSLHSRVKELELQIDPQRSSSGLQNTGQTAKKDK